MDAVAASVTTTATPVVATAAAAVVDENIPWLYITMHNATGVQGIQCYQQMVQIVLDVVL